MKKRWTHLPSEPLLSLKRQIRSLQFLQGDHLVSAQTRTGHKMMIRPTQLIYPRRWHDLVLWSKQKTKKELSIHYTIPTLFDRLRSQLKSCAPKSSGPDVADGHIADVPNVPPPAVDAAAADMLDPNMLDPNEADHNVPDPKDADGPTVYAPTSKLHQAVKASAPVGSAARPVLVTSPAPGVVPSSGSRAIHAVSPAVGSASRPVEIVSPAVGSASRPVEIMSPAMPHARLGPLPLKSGGASQLGQAGAREGELIDELSPTGLEAVEGLVGLRTGMFPASLLFKNRGQEAAAPKTSGRTKAAVKLGLGRRSAIAKRQSPSTDQQQVCDATAATSDRPRSPIAAAYGSQRHPMCFTPPSCSLGFSLVARQPSQPIMGSAQVKEPVAKDVKSVSFAVPEVQTVQRR